MAKNCECLEHNSVGANMMQENRRVRNPRKQRKKHFNAPAHIRHKLMAAPLSNELVSSRGVRTLPVRKGDTVRILRGDNKGFEGKVSRVVPKEYRIYLEGLTREKVDGTNIFLPVHPSKVVIRNLNLDDKRRKDILERKKEIAKPEKEKVKVKPAKKAEKVPEKPKAEAEEVKEEKPVEQPLIEEKVAIEAAKEQVPAEKVSEKITAKTPKKAPAAKKAAAKKTAPRKPVLKKPAEKEVPLEKKTPITEEAPAAEEKIPVEKIAKPRKTARKTASSKKPPAKETAVKKTATKPRVKRKNSEKTEGGQ